MIQRLIHRTALGLCIAAPLLAIAAAPLMPQLRSPGSMIASADDDAARARELVESAIARYRQLRSYSDVARASYNIETEGGTEGNFRGTPASQMDQVMSLAWQSPNLIALDTGQTRVYCDGTNLWVAYLDYGQYTKRPAPDSLVDADQSILNPAMLVNAHPVLGFIYNEEYGDLSSMPTGGFEGATREVYQLRPGQRVHGTMVSEDDMMSAPAPFTIWIDDATGLIGEITFDMTASWLAAEQMNGGGQSFDMDTDDEDEGDSEEEDDDDVEDRGFTLPAITKFEVVIQFEDVRVNEPMGTELFAFEAGPGMEQVEAFDPDSGEASQNELVGSLAPGFSGVDLDGTNISLDDFDDMVVVLDFWGTWCPRCVQALPEMQALKEAMAGRDVVLLGINQDGGPQATDMVRGFLAQKRVDIPQVMDTGEIAVTYNVNAYPTVVIIDQEGDVHEVLVGYAGDGGAHLRGIIEELLDS